MKILSMFVMWQHEKPRVVTDHAASGLNDGIPREEAHVQYDDMHSFSQALYDAIKNNPLHEIVTFKSDIASTFLNLPAHPSSLANKTNCHCGWGGPCRMLTCVWKLWLFTMLVLSLRSHMLDWSEKA